MKINELLPDYSAGKLQKKKKNPQLVTSKEK